MAQTAARRKTAPFPLGTWMNPDTGKTEPRMVEVYEPDDVDLFALTRVARLIERAEQTRDARLTVDVMGHFGDIIDGLFVHAEDRRYALDAVISRTLGIEEYGMLAVNVLTHFRPEAAEQAPRTGPRPTKRAARARR